ncbi:MAG: hypothetical protein HFG32_11300 [Eubacterium sp.]|jgi:hypothetical protein|nr:hypothetical protein [Eubacterium sp.]
MKRKVAAAGILLACGVVCGLAQHASESQAAGKYTISKSTKPCNTSYRKLRSYNSKTKHYYTIKSYLEKLKSRGGGTLVLKKGTYKVCSTLVIPSNVTIQLKNGAKLKKTYETGSSSLKPTKTLFKLSSKAKDYKGTKKVSITGAKNATIDLGQVSNATAIDMAHNYNVNISKIQFKGKKGGAYINIAGSKKVKVEDCSFTNGAKKSGDKFQTAITVNSEGATPCLNVKVQSNTFQKLESGIASTKYKKTAYSTKISIKKNTFTDMENSAIKGKMWDSPVITSNTVKRSDNTNATSSAVRLYSIKDPEVSKNTIQNCGYAVNISRASSVDNTISQAKISSMKNNKVKSLNHYYVPYKNKTTVRLLYFQSKDDNTFTITPSTKPYQERYEEDAAYKANGGQAKTYFMFRSYMEQLEYAGGGTLNVQAGTYKLSHSVCIPSNVTINFQSGVKIQKVKAVDTNLATNKTMFEIVPPSKEQVKNSVSGYNGSQNVTLQGDTNVIIDCDNVLNAMGVVMGHAQNVTIRNIAFTNEYGSHFIELNSSKNVTIENCSFTDFRIYSNKSHKEAINVDTTDLNNNGFNYEWSTHDRTACNTVNINNCMFTNMGAAVGSHTYSVDMSNQQVYHENVTIQNCKVNQTYNAAVRMWNWRNAVIRNNQFLGIQGLEDNKGYNYTCILVRGAVNPTITGNTFSKGGTKKKCAICIEIRSSASVAAAVSAGYADTICEISEQNYADLKKNTVLEGCYKYYRVEFEDGTYKPKKECMFEVSDSADDGEDTSQNEEVKDDDATEG